MKLRLNLLFYLITFNLFTQENQSFTHLKKELKKTIEEFSSEISFKRSVEYYLNKKWDSTLIYSQKQLVTNKVIELESYLHFLRGSSFYHKELYKESIKEYKLVKKQNKLHSLSRMFLGSLYLELNDFEKAISYFKELENLPEKEYIFIKKNSVIHNLGISYLHLKKYNKAENYLIRSLEYQVQKQDTLELVGSYGDVANLYYQQYKDDLAIPYYIKAYELAKKTNDFNLKRITTKNMSVVEQNRKDFEKALIYRKEMEIWVDSLNNQNRIYEVAKKEKEFAVAAKQQEVDLLQVENKLKETERNIFLISAISLLAFLGIGAYLFREKVKANRIIAQQKETLDELNSTKDKLFSIVSHDLRSSVNALKSSNAVLLDNLQSKNLDALEHLLQKNSGIVNGAYGLLDNLLNWALLQTDGGYFYIEKHRLFVIVEHVTYNYKALLLEKAIHFENTVSKKAVVAIDQESIKIVLRNLIDNAIKFSKPEGSIKVYAEESNNFWNLIVEDTGLGMSETTRLELLKDSALLNKKEHEDVLGTGLGLSLVKSMIRKNNGKFNIESILGKGTKMIVSLPKTTTNG
ncbi:tetratricopeptide repeat-containing sensor histidine kinase [uncultured Tenacibaculum sp.]|uniref:tetratricopeptide repeat-containing sensor histidine kinase n=1 Tax=uncultured Tenacibaculum sp. TaxID=174713 RepID=UPI002636B348|nr:tetratricopeptide repeat-containing sensor histidine kinase [uncultured Tenacibaculum sp.]